MGITKSMWMESLERGWKASDKVVCSECVEDDFLKKCISDHAEVAKCDYCGRISADPIAAPVEEIMHTIGETFNKYFAEPGAASVSSDGDKWVIEPISTFDALMSLPLNCHEDLFNDIESFFHEDSWIFCADGFWMSEHPSEIWGFMWEQFKELIINQTRYFFEIKENRPGEILNKIGGIIEDVELYDTLSKETLLYRARTTQGGEVYETFDELGPPPIGIAPAGRMNPEGISYFYLAKESRTALGEVLKTPPCCASIGMFKIKRDIDVLNLSNLPDLPSIFDMENYWLLHSLEFLNHFVSEISTPVEKNNKNSIDYIPSQVISEFFAQVFKSESGRRIEGIIYPSSLVPEGRNVVIFPCRDGQSRWEEMMELDNVEHISVSDWHSFFEKILK